ncbi:HlyD family efflux transporter periplasmic adaptor subunit [Klebsiella quasipneumoniae]|uniref:HlyD family efflux transporter periplasmic adaptor subunit n=1 Tax=Klebsiella quasipneumoniae TaxID=1463165 RepID=UPI0022E427D1|nr:HlyD family efflux transporter periplasmic adaptor subunit [Klebsiella quasipneumoniae]
MKKSLIAAVVIIVLVGGAATFWLSRSSSGNAGEVTLHGNVDIRQVSLAFEESGRIRQLDVQEGDRVHAGQILGNLDMESLEIQARQAAAKLAVQEQTVQEQQAGSRPEEIAQAQAQLASARAQLEKAEQDLKRLQNIAASTGGKGVSKQETDAARSNLRVAASNARERQANLDLLLKGVRSEQRQAAVAQTAALRADLDLLHYRISRGTLKAPVDAVVRARLLEPGDMAGPQKPAFTLALDDPKWVRVWLSESDLGRVRTGMTAQVFSDTWPDRPVTGQIGYISSVAEFTPKSVQTEDLRTKLVYEVRVLVNDPKNTLRMGQPATVKIATDTTQNETSRHAGL